MRRLIIFFVLMTFCSITIAQHTDTDTIGRRLNGIHLNFLGDISLFSLHYERSFPINAELFLTAKFGIGQNQEFEICFSGSCGPRDKYLTIPHHVTANLGSGRLHFEGGIGATFVSGNQEQAYLVYPILGLRLVPRNPKKVIFRLFACPASVEPDELDIIVPPIGLSFGLGF